MTHGAVVKIAQRAAAARSMSPPAPDQAEAFLRDVVVGHCGEPTVSCGGVDENPATCRVCGCTDEVACPGGCCWVEDPAHMGDLCSTCQPFVLERMGLTA